MANCEEKPCANVQSAICLHCNRRLCAPHIVTHGTILLEEADKLCEQINKLAEHLKFSLQQIHTAHNQAINELDIWRQKELDKIEHKYAEKVQVIESRQDYLVDLEKGLVQRLTQDAQKPLERMQIQKSANSQVIQAIRQAITDIIRESGQLEWHRTAPTNQSSSFIPENVMRDTSQQHQYRDNLSNNHFQEHISQNSIANHWMTYQSSIENRPASMYAGTPVNTFLNIPHASMNPTGFQPRTTRNFPLEQTGASPISYWPQPTVPSAASASHYWSQSAAATASIASPFVVLPQSNTSTESQIFNIHSATNSSKTLIDLFKNVSSSNDQILNNFINYNLNQAVHVNNMMILIFSFLSAWHSLDSPTVYNEPVLSYHIFTVKRYIIGRDHELTVILAIQVYVNSCNYDEIKSGQMMTFLLRHFLDHRCITKPIILDWYNNGAHYGYNGFQNAKLWVTPYIVQLNADDLPKQT